MWDYKNGRFRWINLREMREIYCADNVVDTHVHAFSSAVTRQLGYIIYKRSSVLLSGVNHAFPCQLRLYL